MPQLPRDIRLHLIQQVFELGVALAQESVERGAIFDVVEVEWLARAENGCVLGEIAVMRVVEAVYSDNVRMCALVELRCRNSPSTNSRVNIFTCRGRSRRFRSSFAVTVGYSLYSSSMFLG